MKTIACCVMIAGLFMYSWAGAQEANTDTQEASTDTQEASTGVQEANADTQTIPQALSLFNGGKTTECEALISASLKEEDWNSVHGLLLRAENLIHLGCFAKTHGQVDASESIGEMAGKLLELVPTKINETDVTNRVTLLKLRAFLSEALLGDSQEAEQLRQQALALEPPPVQEPLSPPEE